ncbi:MAG: ATP-dependent DNA helicase RecG, partial [Clostridiales bacterium]|nr:ATP-dependent DNA helicase RecG [Clostridiales bacterium]
MELCEIKGIGAKRVQSLNESGIFTPSDLLLRFPDKYIFKDSKIDRNVRDGQEVSFVGTVVAEAVRRFIRRGLSVVVCYLENNGVKIKCSWFNQPFAARNLKSGDRVYACGKVKKFGNAVQMTNPTFVSPQEGDGDIVPIYKTAIPSRAFASAVKTALDNVKVNSFIPKDVGEKYGIMPLGTALRSVHCPSSVEELKKAQRSVAVENMSYVVTSYRLLKDDARDFSYCAKQDSVDTYIKSLPYPLTSDQQKAIDTIISSMRSDKLMNILVQGEVGCGKTAVALCAMYFAAKSGYQSAIMTPTEVLARQHYETMVRILEPLGIKTQLLCASMNKVQRETAMFNIKYGAVSCIVGTQALIGDGIEYDDLRLVIVDEQQRFGVNQRAKLESKGKKTDMIVMTATPIPRTLALSLYGELQQTEIKTMPASRPIVHTSIVPQAKINGMYKYIKERAALDERTYIICPRIDGADDDITGVEDIYGMLKKSTLGEITGCVHGKMKDAEKNEIMHDFKTGKLKVLVSTTVVEVGIDVPEATTVVVYDAERFGLSQLHQIRGRVGRGTKESYCFLISENGTPESDERLKKFCGMKDGFSVSELDFKLRGAGDFVGLRQHGNGSLEIDEDIIERSRALSDAVIADGSSCAAIVRSLNSPE